MGGVEPVVDGLARDLGLLFLFQLRELFEKLLLQILNLGEMCMNAVDIISVAV